MKSIAVLLLIAAATLMNAQDAASCPMHQQHQAEQAQSHAAGVDARGDHAMGFSHETSTHHFLLVPDGGTIEVSANKADDNATREQIRMHLPHIAQMFAAGNFDIPAFIHDTVPPGVEIMKSKRSAISYEYQQTPQGGEVRIKSADPDAVAAIHEFLRFQIEEHRTGNPTAVAPGQ